MMQNAIVLPVPGPVPAVIVPPKLTSLQPVAITDPASVAGPTPSILFGRDANGRPHGASLTGDLKGAERAADLMDLYCFPANTETLRQLATKLPAGRLFPASGKAFVPFTSAALYEQLLTATDTRETPTPAKAAGKPAEGGGSTGAGNGRGAGGSGAGDPPATRIGAKAPSDHSQIGLGSLVLAQGDDEDDEGYYPATVILTKADDQFVLTWADYSDLPEFYRPRRALALLHPKTAGEAA